jgi:hypothetical protein
MNLIHELALLKEGQGLQLENLTFIRYKNRVSIKVGPPLRPIPEGVTPSTPEQIEVSRLRLENSLNDQVKYQ